jgi:hypothetical protein
MISNVCIFELYDLFFELARQQTYTRQSALPSCEHHALPYPSECTDRPKFGNLGSATDSGCAPSGANYYH